MLLDTCHDPSIVVPLLTRIVLFSRSDMHYALDKLDGSELDGRRIKLVEEGRGRGRYNRFQQ